jgi:hypothetical protein
MWNEEVHSSSLVDWVTLGPAAGNLEGARVGAEFISGRVDELIRNWDERDSSTSRYGSEESHEDAVDLRRLGLGM